jgi:hypothetical protein
MEGKELMEKKKVVVMALHDELESAYPPLNVAVGAASSGAESSWHFPAGESTSWINGMFPSRPRTLNTYQMR